MAIAPPAHIEIRADGLVAALELVQGGGDQPGAGGADRVAEGDRAAVDVDLVHVDPVLAGPREDDGGERLVDLEQVEVGDRHAGAVEQLLGRLDRAVEVVVGVRPDQAVGLDPGPRGQAEGTGLVLVHDQHGGGAVGDLGRRAGGVQAAGEHRREAGQPLERGVAQPLVGVDDAVGRGERRDLALEPALVDRDPGLLLGGQAERVEVGAGQPAATCDPVGGLELVGHVDRPVVRPRVTRAGRDVGAQRDARHRLDPAGDADVDGARRDHVVHEVRGLLARAALGVHGGGTGALGEPGVQPGPADHVVGLLTGLGDAAADHLVDQLRIDAGAAQHLGLGEAQQRRRVHAREPAVPLAERRADGIDDHGVAHGQKLELVLV